MCSAMAAPKVPPPMTMKSNGRPPLFFQALTSLIVAEIAALDVAGERGFFSCEWHGDGVQWAVSFAFVEWKLASCSQWEAWGPPNALFLISFSSCAHIPNMHRR